MPAGALEDKNMEWIMNHMVLPIFYLLVLSIAVSVMSLTVTKTKVFKSLRLWVKNKSEFFGELFTCPYCFSFYPSLFLVFFYFSRLQVTYGPSFTVYGSNYYPFDFVLVWFCMVCIASFITGFIYRSISQIE
jgi:hypothetical protein